MVKAAHRGFANAAAIQDARYVCGEVVVSAGVCGWGFVCLLVCSSLSALCQRCVLTSAAGISGRRIEEQDTGIVCVCVCICLCIFVFLSATFLHF